MTKPSLLDSMGLSDETDMIWTATLAAIERKGYRIRRPPSGGSARLGEGTFAAVFYAEHVQDKTPFAIKVFRDEDEDKVASYQREVKTLRAEDFPRQFAVTAYDIWHEPGAQPFIVMEYVRGQPIDEFCHQQGLPPSRRIELGESVLRGLQVLHRSNIQHRDISVANILIDGEGHVRYLDFGLAGEIIRTLRHTTLDARGNRAYTPAEVVKGEKQADAKDDIFACGMLLIHILTGDPPPENTTRSGDSEHLARCQRQLAERGIRGRLTRIVLRSLAPPEHRYAQPDAMADALFDYRVRRPQRIRTGWIGLAAAFILACLTTVGWWRYEQLRYEAAFRDYDTLREQVNQGLDYAQHDAVAQRLRQAQQLRQQRHEHYLAGRRTDEQAALQQEMQVLQQALDINTGLGRCLPRLETLGIPLNETPWVDQSPVIVQRQTGLARRYQEINAMLAAGRSGDAGTAIDALQLELVQLIRDNTEAGAAATVRTQFHSLAGSVSKRLQEDAGFAERSKPEKSKMLALAEKAWESGDWKQTGLLFGQAMQELNEWLKANEQPDERAARTKAGEAQIAALETEQGRLRGEVNRITAERDQREQRVKELENRIADITLERVAAMDNLNAARASLTRESAKRTEAEKLAQQRAELVNQLTAEKAALEQQTKQLQEKTASLEQLQGELALAQQQAKTLTAQLAAAERQATHWKQVAEANAAQPSPALPVQVPATVVADATPLPTRRNATGIELIRIPAGKYQRGARDGEGTSDEKPQHWVQISHDFEVGRYEVTQAIYSKVMGKNPSWFFSTGSGSDRVGGMDTSDFPAESMSWFDTLEFCNKLSVAEKLRPYYELTDVQRDGDSITSATVKVLGGDGYRLPTEGEWEYVARAGSTTIFPWGDSLSATQANFNLGRPAKVGSYAPNAWGLCDTQGNVWEWVWDGYGEAEYQQFAAMTAVDPQGPSAAMARVIRGGNWPFHGDLCRRANRFWGAPGWRKFDLGFRVARGLSSE